MAYRVSSKAGRRARALGWALLTAFAAGALGPPPVAAHPESAQRLGKTQTGLASYYGRAFDGKPTASGEIFDSTDLTAAHPSYPLGTVVRVTNLKKDRSVVLRITDRGPTAPNQREGVIIDVSRAAANELDMRKEGRVKVRVEVLEWGSDERRAPSVQASSPGAR
jgi:rare lipoprotein A